MSIIAAIPVGNNPEDVTPIPEDSVSLQTYIQDRRVIGVSGIFPYMMRILGYVTIGVFVFASS